MTVPSPRTPVLGRLAARLLAFAAAGAVVSALMIGPAAASASPTPTPSPTTPQASGTTTLTLAPIQNGIYLPGQALTTSVTIANGTRLVVPASDATLQLGTTALASREALTTWLSGDVSGVPLTAIASGTVDATPPNQSASTAIMVAADQPDVAALTPGAHPLLASFETPDGTIQSTSVLVVPEPDRPIGIGVIVPITAGPGSDALLTPALLEELTGDSGALTRQLDGVAQTPAILAIDPAIAASIRALGTRAPESATEWLERLDALPNTRIALQFGDADPAVQIEAGLPQPLTPTTFGPLLREGDFPDAPAVSQTPTPTPTPTPTSTIPPSSTSAPTTEDLLDVSASRGAVFWPAGDAVTPAAVETLGALTDGDSMGLTLVPSTSATAGGARAAAGDAGVLVYDADVSRELSSAASIEESSLRAAPLAAASAYLSFAGADAGDAPVLAALDRSIERSHIGLQTAISAASGYPGAVTHSILTLSAGAPRAVSIADATPPAERVADATVLLSDEVTLSQFATILDDPTLLTGPERATILQLLSVAWAPDPSASRAAVADHRSETRETLDSVRLLPPATINLFAAGAGLPFTVRNDLPYPVNVVLYATPDDLRLGVQRSTEVVATPESNTAVQVPVEARIGNGDVTLSLQLRSPSYVEIGPEESVEVNVRAEWETVGLVVLAIVVGGLLVLGIVRTVLKARARRRPGGDE